MALACNMETYASQFQLISSILYNAHARRTRNSSATVGTQTNRNIVQYWAMHIRANLFKLIDVDPYQKFAYMVFYRINC